MGDLRAVVLPSGIGVRFKDLTPTQSDAVLLAAAEELPQGTTSFVRLTLTETRHGLEAMLQQVTTDACKKKALEAEVEEDDPANPGTKRKVKKIVAMEWDVNSPDNKWVKFQSDDKDGFNRFDARDYAVLKSIYSSRNHVSPGEVALILGKAEIVVTP